MRRRMNSRALPTPSRWWVAPGILTLLLGGCQSARLTGDSQVNAEENPPSVVDTLRVMGLRGGGFVTDWISPALSGSATVTQTSVVASSGSMVGIARALGDTALQLALLGRPSVGIRSLTAQIEIAAFIVASSDEHAMLMIREKDGMVYYVPTGPVMVAVRDFLNPGLGTCGRFVGEVTFPATRYVIERTGHGLPLPPRHLEDGPVTVMVTFGSPLVYREMDMRAPPPAGQPFGC